MRGQRLLFNDQPKTDEINVSPLIDIVFILLIFFIVTTVFVEESGVDVQRPRAASSSHLDKNSIQIAITAEGQVYYGGRQIGVSGVRGIVRRMLKGQADTPVIIQADKDVSVDVYTRVHDEAALAGATQISLATKNG